MDASLRTSQPYWVATAPVTGFAPLSGDVTVEVAVIGGGIVGLSAAALLQSLGREVAVIEAGLVGRQATGCSTAKVTAQHGVIYGPIIDSFGRDGAKAYAEANREAVERVARFVEDLGLDCDFQRKSAYVYTRSPDQVGRLEREAGAARSLGLPADFTRDVPLPFPTEGALRFADQAQFHPCKYAAGLARHIVGGGGHVYERTRGLSVDRGEPCRVMTDRGSVTARDVIVATQLPTVRQGFFFAKAYPHSQPVVAGPVDPARAPDGMFISAETPVLSVLTAPHDPASYLVAAGAHYRSGDAVEAATAMVALERTVGEAFGVETVEHRWTNQDYESMDGIPFVGKASAGDRHLFVATGFHGWGLSNGTAAGMILADVIAGRPNPWASLFDARRIRPVASARRFLQENTQVAGHFLGGYARRRPSSPDELRPAEAAVFNVKGAHVAAWRDEAGSLHEVSAVCTHMKCIVGWNPIDRTWDCPCHGSRFTADGAVIRGPAVSPLEPRGSTVARAREEASARGDGESA